MRTIPGRLTTILLVAGSTVGFGQSMLSVSSASATAGSPVTLNISLNTAYPGQSEGLQWTLNVPTGDVASYSTTAGPIAGSAGKSLACNNNTCLISGMTSTALANGVV